MPFKSSCIIKRTQAYRFVEFRERVQVTDGAQGSYNLSLELEERLRKDGAIVVAGQEVRQSTKHIEYEINDEVRLLLGTRICALIGNGYENRHNKLRFTHTEGLDGSSAKFQAIKTKNATRGKEYEWFVDLYNSNFQRAELSFEWDDSRKQLLVEVDYPFLRDEGIALDSPLRPLLPPPPPPMSPNVNRLTIALKLFKEMRYGEEWQKNVIRDSYLSIYDFGKSTPEEFAALSIEAFKSDVMDKVWAFANGGVRKWGQLDDGEKAAYQAYVVEMRRGLKSYDAYFPPSTQCPRGLGVGVVTELLMRFYPTSCCSYNKDLIWDALVTLGLASGEYEWPKKPSIYQDFMGKCANVLRRMEDMKFGRSPQEGDKNPPDYVTVNEFFWFVHDYKDLIKEKIMCAQLKPVNSKDSLKKGTKKLNEAFAGDALLKRLAAALRTKPFAILAGHSGTGKSQLVRRLAYMTCNNQKLIDEGKEKTAPGNYCMVQVKPNWHDSTDLIGYYSDLHGRHFVNTAFVQFLCKAYAYPETPFFLCLDEMNLAPVEQYFAEYLSAIESLEKKGDDWVSDSLIEIVKTGEKDENGNAKVDEEILGQIIAGAQSTEAADWIRKHGLTIPKNLFVVGTVNMDETTCQFSRKVLDRAMTLLMNDVKFAEMGKSVDPSKEELLDEAGIAFFMQGGRRGHVGTAEAELLDKLNKPLENTPFVVAYRFANEYALYEEALANLGGVEPLADGELDQAKIDDYWKKVSECAADALDQVVLMKLLPRIHGMKEVVKGIFEGRKVDGKDIPGLKEEVKSDGLSYGMMASILKRADEYLTFWP